MLGYQLNRESFRTKQSRENSIGVAFLIFFFVRDSLKDDSGFNLIKVHFQKTAGVVHEQRLIQLIHTQVIFGAHCPF